MRRGPALLALALLAACCGSEKDEATASRTNAQAPAPETASPQAPDPPAGADVVPPSGEPPSGGPPTTVTLVEAGLPPLTLLRLRAEAGVRQDIELRSTTTTIQPGPGGGVARPSPTLTTRVVVEVEPGTSADELRYAWTLESVDMTGTEGMPPQALEGLTRGLESVKGSVARGVFDRRAVGEPPALELAPGSGVRASQAVERLRALLHEQLVPLPLEAVGVGGKWRVRRSAVEEGFRLDVTTTCEVLAIEGDLVRVRATTKRQAGRQVVSEPGGLPDSTAELRELSGEGVADVEISLGLPFPRSVSSRLTSAQSFVLIVRGARSVVAQAAETKVELLTR